MTRNTPPHSEHFLAIYSLTQEELNWITLCTCIAPFALFPDSSTEAGMGYCYEQIAPIYSPSCERKKEEVQKNYHRSRFLSFLPLPQKEEQYHTRRNDTIETNSFSFPGRRRCYHGNIGCGYRKRVPGVDITTVDILGTDA